MSFILDALKKSEADRQENGVTEFSGLPTRAEPAAVPRWLWLVAILLAINLAVLIGLLWRPDTPSTAPSTATSTPVDSPIINQNSAVASFEDQVAARGDLPVQPAESDTETGNRSEFDPPDVITQNPASVQTESVYPTIHEVRARGATGIPDLHLDIHVYSAEPEGRFVFINMAKLREGETLSQGLVLREILPDGVVLDRQGELFLLPRE